tara:strand:- start:11978 stop:12103 length:126 start_codon:yes stop_codon:yes gene_type:complete
LETEPLDELAVLGGSLDGSVSEEEEEEEEDPLDELPEKGSL